MVNMSATVEAKSDQLNSDDLIGGPRTITITGISGASGEQPIDINYEGDNGKPWKPCKTMRRLLIALWGDDGKVYIGRKLRIFRDPEVIYGGDKVGGIRISHASHINEAKTFTLTATRKNKKPHTVQPLGEIKLSPEELATLQTAGERAASRGTESLQGWWSTIGGAKQKLVGGEQRLGELKKVAAEADAKAKAATSSAGDEEEHQV